MEVVHFVCTPRRVNICNEHSLFFIVHILFLSNFDVE